MAATIWLKIYPTRIFFSKENLDDPLNFLVIKLYGGFDLQGGMIQPNAFLTPKNILEKAGPWNAAISPCPDEDGEYFCRVLLNSEGIVYQHETLNYYRKSKSKKTLSGVKDEKALSKLVDSVWLKHTHLLEQAKSDGQVTNIHTTQQITTLRKYMCKCIRHSGSWKKKISKLQKNLSPSLKPSHYKLGGKAINTISALFGWKFGPAASKNCCSSKKKRSVGRATGQLILSPDKTLFF